MGSLKDFFCNVGIVIIILMIGCASGIMLDMKVIRPTTIKTEIKEVSVPVTKYIREVRKDDTVSLLSCYESPIKIGFYPGDIHNGVLPIKIVSQDLCKSTEQEFSVTVAENDGWKVKLGIGTVVVAGLAGVYTGYKLFR